MIFDVNLWNSLPLPALLVSPDDKIVELNPAAELFFNQSAKGFVGQPIWDKIMIDADIEGPFERARDGQASLFINDVDVGSGERPPLQCNIQIAPLQGAERHMLLLVSPRKMADRMTKNVLSSTAARSAIGMAEMLAHEIKNPLAGITGAAQLLSMNLTNGDQELTDLIVAESRRIVTLLEQVEQFGNLSKPRQKAVNIHDVLDRARQSAAVSFGAHMTLTEDYDPSLPQTYADGDQLLQVFLNLVKNACEASPDGGSITIRTFYDNALRIKRADRSVAKLPLQVEIIDDGPGLPEEIAGDIFEPFVSGRENGTGLGLALVSKLIVDNGGWITVDSAPGRTVFRVALPRLPADMTDQSTDGDL